MARVVGGVGVSHSPQLSIEPGGWRAHGDLEQERLAQLNLPPSGRTPDQLASELSPVQIASRYAGLPACPGTQPR